MADVLAVVVDLLTVAAGVVALWYGGLLFVEGAARVARRVGISELVVGLTVVALGTSLPEAAVTVEAALLGRPDVAVGNVVGSNVLNIGLVLGGITLLGPVAASRTLVRRDGAAMLGAAVAVAAVAWDLTVTRVEAAALLVAFLAYVGFLAAREASDDETGTGGTPSKWTVVRLVGGFALVVAGANLLVGGASSLARTGGISEWVIGETVVAIGTSTPEVVASVAAARRGLGDIAAGNLVGSCVFNGLGILGLAGVITPLVVAAEATPSLLWLVGTSLLVLVVLGTGGRLSIWEGVPLSLATLSKWVYDLLG